MNEVVTLDIDNTIAEGFSQGLFVKYLYSQRKVSLFFMVTIGVWLFLYKIGIINNPKSAMEYGLSYIKGKSKEEVCQTIKNFFDNEWIKKVYPGMKSIIDEHIKNGRAIILLSNAPQVLVDIMAKYLGASHALGTNLEVINGYYTGKIIGEIMYGKQKKDNLIKYINDSGFNLENSWGYGDHYSDYDFLSVVSHPHAVNPDNKLRKIALKNNWKILNFRI